MTSTVGATSSRTSRVGTETFDRVSDAYLGPEGLRPALGERRQEVADPATADRLGSFTEPTIRQIDAAVAGADAAQADWYARSALERAELLHGVAHEIRRQTARIAEIMTLETGKPFKESADELGWSAFTGSVPTGRIVARTCAEAFKPHLIEASGSDSFIVMPSAPVEVAARGAAFAAFLNCGQVCTSAEKILVHEAIYDEFMTAFMREVERLRIGHGLDTVDIGPMENERERERVERLLARALEQGARLVTGGSRPDLPEALREGFFFQPTIIENCTDGMELYTQEVFGPIAPVYKVVSFDEALQLTNRSPFGLGATLYSTDILEIDRAQREIVAGMVWINAPLLDNDAGPFGGRKLSGIGRQLGAEGLDTFRHTKLVMVDPAVSVQDFWWFPYPDDEAWSANSGD